MSESTAMKLSFTARRQLMVTQRIHAIIQYTLLELKTGVKIIESKSKFKSGKEREVAF